MIGICNLWVDRKGYGFITVKNGVQVFLHASNFMPGEKPVIGAFITFTLGAPVPPATKPQAVAARFSSAEEVQDATKHGLTSLGGK